MKFQKLLLILAGAAFMACNTAQKTASVNTKAASPASTMPAAPVVSATAGTKVPMAAPTFVSWDKKMVDLGKVKKGEKRTLFFEMTNTSGQEAQIEIVDACECTRVDFPRGPIPAGGKGRLDVTFDSTEKDADETIGINVVFKQTDAAGNPRIETVEYKFELVK